MKDITIFLILFVFIIGSQGVTAQESSKEKKKQDKEARKKEKEERELADWNLSKQLAESRQFVFTADQINTGAGMTQVDSKVNFFVVNGENATFQFAFYQLQSIPNPNGLGGVTSDGKITRYKYTANNPKKPISVEVTVKPMAAQGSGVHNMVVNMLGDGYGELILPEGTTRLRGKIVPLSESKIIKGGHY